MILRLTVEDIKQRFEAEGETICGWAEKRGVSKHTVYAVLNGRVCGKRGLSHKIAIALGLKSLPSSATNNE